MVHKNATFQGSLMREGVHLLVKFMIDTELMQNSVSLYKYRFYVRYCVSSHKSAHNSIPENLSLIKL